MRTGLNNLISVPFKNNKISTPFKGCNYNALSEPNLSLLPSLSKDSVNFSNNTNLNSSPTEMCKVIPSKNGNKNISFTGNTKPNTSKSFRVMKEILDAEFITSLNRVSKLGQIPVSKIKDDLKLEYGNETANAVKISGEKAGFNNLVLMIPGINPDGTVPDLFPVINPKTKYKYMGGDHWVVENHLLNNIMHEIKKKYPDFSFEQLRKDLKMNPINKSKALPVGASLPTKGVGAAIINSKNALDKDYNANYASIHGFVVFDDNDNNYIILDNKPGIKEFVRKNQNLFDNLAERFYLKAIIIGGEPIIKNSRVKEKNDLINQLRGELYMAKTDITEFSNSKNPKEISSTNLIELLTNPMSNKKYIQSLQR
ncbi:MAG: hypothetical protein A2104_06585 [Candidatus Melainabacteria bacterium GWF2_32_7]|nr:MAG: hypothetical protein A2104_06585 [Candidatus Melainabacteria bacterium GWF2_32_7]